MANIKIAVRVVALLLLVSVISGCAKADELSDEYRKGYAEGQKAEQAQWPDQYLELANKIVTDQIESQSNIQNLIQGKVSDLKIDHVEKKGSDRALVWLAAEYKDKSYLTGYIEFQKIDDKWFLITTRKTVEETPVADDMPVEEDKHQQ